MAGPQPGHSRLPWSETQFPSALNEHPLPPNGSHYQMASPPSQALSVSIGADPPMFRPPIPRIRLRALAASATIALLPISVTLATVAAPQAAQAAPTAQAAQAAQAAPAAHVPPARP